MPEYFDLTNITSNGTRDFVGFASSVDQTIFGGYVIGALILFILFSVFFIAMKSKGHYTSAAFAVASWVTGLSAILLRGMNLLSDLQWFLGITLIPLSIVVLWIATSSDV